MNRKVGSRLQKSALRSHGAKSPGADLLSDLAWAEVARSLMLSPREIQITRAVFANLTEGAMAAALRMSEHTVHSHLNRLFAKLRVTTRVQVVLRIMEELMILTVADGSPLPPICGNRTNGRCGGQLKSKA